MVFHVLNRGVNRQNLFDKEGDHLIAVPETEQALRRAIGEAHRRYTRRINFREKWRGYLWQDRFASFVMDEPYLLATARYVELNPVRVHLAEDVADWPFSSAKAHLSAVDDCLVETAPLLAIIDDWGAFLDSAIPEKQLDQIRDHGRTGRPLGDMTFLQRLEEIIGRILVPKKPGRRPKFPKFP